MRPAVLAGVLAGALAACAGSPPVRLHSLMPVEAAAAVDVRLAALPAAASAPGLGPAPPPASARPLRVVIGPVAVPAALDQPQWLVREPDDSLRLLEQDRWAGPLGEEFRGALRESLRRRWAATDALPSAGGGPAWRVTVDVLRLDARPGVDSLLEARWVVQAPQASVPAMPSAPAPGPASALRSAPADVVSTLSAALSASCSTRLREPVQGDGPAALAAAHRRAVARLADDIGRQLQAMAGGAGAACVAAPVS